jgi:pimeloyl-ACP methyl ester carboxylesterase
VSDVVAVVNTLKSKDVIFLAHSFGCLLAIAAASELKNIKGLILIDKGVRANKISDKWLAFVQENPPTTSAIDVARKIHESSQAIDLSEMFRNLKLPALFFKGELEGSHLGDAEVSDLLDIPGVSVVSLMHSAHSPSPEDYGLFIDQLKMFIRSIRS